MKKLTKRPKRRQTSLGPSFVWSRVSSPSPFLVVVAPLIVVEPVPSLSCRHPHFRVTVPVISVSLSPSFPVVPVIIVVPPWSLWSWSPAVVVVVVLCPCARSLFLRPRAHRCPCLALVLLSWVPSLSPSLSPSQLLPCFHPVSSCSRPWLGVLWWWW
jgi:hypothetical protein